MLEVAQKYLQLKSGEYYKCFGKVDKVVGLTIESIGPKAKLNDLCMIFLDKERRDYVMSEVVGFKDSHIILMPFDNVEGVGVGCIVENTGHPLTVAVGDELLGHTVDGIGRVTDCDEKDLKLDSEYPIEAPPPDPMSREIISDVLPLGVKAVDGLITVGKGQRIGIFAGSGVGKSIIAKNSLVAMSSSDGENNNNQSFHEQIEYLERITTNLHESVMKVRMVPIESVTQKYPRMIRDLSRTLNKKMNLVITGEDTELDRTVVDQIGDPLQHLLRNSADHGLESNEVRLERGKPEVGTIFLNAYQEGNNVVIKVGDDGNGIDTEAVKNKAIERGIVTAEQAENLSQKDIINFLFMPSFSMAKQITDISGRGVGLDVVKSGIEQLGGDVSVSTELGKGTTFTVRLPLTLAIIQALMVEIRDEIYAIALGSISNIEDIPVKDIKYVQAKEVIHLRGSVIPIIRLDKMLDIEPKEQEPDHLTVVIVQKGDQQAGLVVDNLIGQQEIVIKSLGKYINGNKLISGATILGDGDVALILDVNTLM